MFLNKLKKYTIGTVPFFMTRKFAKDKKLIDMFVYSNEIENNNSGECMVLVKRDIYLNQQIWSRKNKPLFNQSKPIRVYPDSNIHDYSNSFISTENIIPPLKNTFFINVLGLNKADTDVSTTTTTTKITTTTHDEEKPNLLLFKKIQQVEKLYKKDNPVAHFFTDHYYFVNKLQSIDENENNIFFVDSTKIIKKCSECNGKIEELGENEKNKLKEANYFTTITKDANISFKLDDVCKLVKCNKCKLIMDKQINELINMQRKAESLITKSSFYYLPHFLLFYFLWNDSFILFMAPFLFWSAFFITLPATLILLILDQLYIIYSFFEKKLLK